MSEQRQCCAMCGFLVRRNVKTGALEPCTQDHRGWMGFDPYDGGGMLHCSKLEQDLAVEWRQQLERLGGDTDHGGNLHRAAVSAVTYGERDCRTFRQWDPIRSPKEQEDRELVERIQALYQQQRAEDLARLKEFCERHEEWQMEMVALASRHHRLAVIALIVATVGCLSSALAWLVMP